MTRWPLRIRLLFLPIVALLPILALAGWHAAISAEQHDQRRSAEISRSAESAILPQRASLEATRRLLLGLRENSDIVRWVQEAPGSGEVARCEAHFRRILLQFPGQYSALLLTDRTGVARCSSSPAAANTSFADREVFARVQDGKDFVIAAYTASRLSKETIIPTATPIVVDGSFGGMLALGVVLKDFASATGSPRPGTPILTFVDSHGEAIVSQSDGGLALPMPARTAKAITGRESAFSDYGRNGEAYEYRLLPLASTGLIAVAAMPARGFLDIVQPWIGFALLVLACLVALGALWIGSARWCLEPLKPIHAFAAAMARGQENVPPLTSKGPPELLALADDIAGMAAAIRTREDELRAGVELRDHMLREIHHRVKNNLQMISSLLSLQGERIRSPRIRRHFTDAQNRVLALSVLHRHLYERSSWALVDFQLFINDLVRQLTIDRGDTITSRVRFDIRAPIIAVGPDTAIPVGLIVTEAVSNAFRHAFNGIESPRITIHAAETSGGIEFRIEDNGTGIQQRAIDESDGEGLGFTLIRGLAAQLGGDVEVKSADGSGTSVVIRFPLPK